MAMSVCRPTLPVLAGRRGRRRQHRSRRHRQVHAARSPPASRSPTPRPSTARSPRPSQRRRADARRMAAYERQAVLDHCVAPLPRARRGAGARALHRGRQADPRRARRSHAPDRHLPHRRRGVGAHRRRGACRSTSAPRATRLPRHVEARADRPLLVHLAVQLPAEPGGPQDRAGARRRLPVRAQAGEPDAGRRADHRRGAGRDRPAARARSRSCPATATAPICSPTDERLKLLSFTGSPDGRLGPQGAAPARRRSCSSSAATRPSSSTRTRTSTTRSSASCSAPSTSRARAASACSASSSHEAIYDDAARAARRSRPARSSCGDPRDETTFIGPMISEREADAPRGLDRARRSRAGAQAALRRRAGDGAMLEADAARERAAATRRSAREEAFGPVAAARALRRLRRGARAR